MIRAVRDDASAARSTVLHAQAPSLVTGVALMSSNAAPAEKPRRATLSFQRDDHLLRFHHARVPRPWPSASRRACVFRQLSACSRLPFRRSLPKWLPKSGAQPSWLLLHVGSTRDKL